MNLDYISLFSPHYQDNIRFSKLDSFNRPPLPMPPHSAENGPAN